MRFADVRCFSTLPIYRWRTIGMEACAGSNYWGRELEQLGHCVKLIPAQHVKPLARGQNNVPNPGRTEAHKERNKVT